MLVLSILDTVNLSDVKFIFHNFLLVCKTSRDFSLSLENWCPECDSILVVWLLFVYLSLLYDIGLVYN